MTRTTKKVHYQGADLVYDYEGSGPLLLLIPGGGGDAARYYRIMKLLAEEYTVVSYDRRGNSRSTGGGPLDMAQQARDAAAVIGAMGAERGLVFGNSGGANIALRLAEDLPSVITGMVVHEGPTYALLPDATTWCAFAERIHRTYSEHGATEAITAFTDHLVGFDQPLRAGTVQNADFFLAEELLPLTRFVPNFDAIRGNRVPTVAGAGKASADAPYARTARLHAERLGCDYVEFPGHHVEFVADAGAFAATLTTCLRGLGRTSRG